MNYGKNEGTNLLMSVIRSLSASENYQQREIEKAKLERAFKESDEIIDKMINEHANDFSTIIQSFSKISTQMTELIINIKDIKQNLDSCKNLFNCQRDDLKVLWLEGSQHKFILEMLENIEMLKTVPNQIENKLNSKHYLSLAELYVLARDLQQIEGLREIKAEILTKKDRIKYQIVRDLRNHIYIRTTTVRGSEKYRAICDPNYYNKFISPPQGRFDRLFLDDFRQTRCDDDNNYPFSSKKSGHEGQQFNHFNYNTTTQHPFNDQINSQRYWIKSSRNANQNDRGGDGFFDEAKTKAYLAKPVIENVDLEDPEYDSAYFIAICVQALVKLNLIHEVFELWRLYKIGNYTFITGGIILFKNWLYNFKNIQLSLARYISLLALDLEHIMIKSQHKYVIILNKNTTLTFRELRDFLFNGNQMLKTSLQSDLCSIVLVTAHEIKSRSIALLELSKLTNSNTGGGKNMEAVVGDLFFSNPDDDDIYLNKNDTRLVKQRTPTTTTTTTTKEDDNRPELFRILLQQLFAKFWSIAAAHNYALECFKTYAPAASSSTLLPPSTSKRASNPLPTSSSSPPAGNIKKGGKNPMQASHAAVAPPYDIIDVWSFLQGVFQMTLIEYLAMESSSNSNEASTGSYPTEMENLNDYYNIKSQGGFGKRALTKKSQPLFKFENSAMALNAYKYAREQRKRKSLAFLATSSLEDSNTNILPPLLNSFPIVNEIPLSTPGPMSPFIKDSVSNNPIMVCKPNIKNLRLVYRPIKEFCKHLEYEIKLKPPSRCILFSFFTDYIREIYLVDIHNSVSSKIENHLKGVDAWKCLVTFDPKLHADVDRPLLLNAYLVSRCIFGLKDIIKDMPDYSNQFLLMICKILQSYKEACFNVFKNIVQHDTEDKRIISASWAKDEDINRFLRSLPNWLFMKQQQQHEHGQNQPRTFSMSMTSPLMNSPEISDALSPVSFLSRDSQNETSGGGFMNSRESSAGKSELNCHAKESEILATNLGNEMNIPEYEILSDPNSLKTLAHLHESLEWLGVLKIEDAFVTDLLRDNIVNYDTGPADSHRPRSNSPNFETSSPHPPYSSTTSEDDNSNLIDSTDNGSASGGSAEKKDRSKSIFPKSKWGNRRSSPSRKTTTKSFDASSAQTTYATLSDGTLKMPVSDFVLDSIKAFARDFEELAETSLLVIHLEIRVHCFYHLIPLAKNCDKLIESQATVNGTLTSTTNTFDQDLLKLSTTDVDPSIVKLNNDLTLLEEVLSNSLQKLKLKYVFDGLGHLLTILLINTAANVQRINHNIIKRMCNNIFSLQQNLTNITLNRESDLDRSRSYWEMLYKSPDEIIDSIVERGGPQFTQLEYKNAIKLLQRSYNVPANLQKIQLKKLEDVLKKPVIV